MGRPLRLSLLVLALTTLSCSIFIGGPDLPDPPIAGSPDALQALEGAVAQSLLESLIDGSVNLTFTQEQLTAYLAAWLEKQENPILAEPQVALGDQELVVYGRVHAWIFEANVAATTRVEIDDAGVPHARISRAEIGPLPMPKPLRDSIAATVDEALTGYIGPVVVGFRLESVTISNGLMTVSGRLR